MLRKLLGNKNVNGDVTTSMETKLPCPACRKAHLLSALFRERATWWREVEVVVTNSPTNGDCLEARVETGVVTFGYTYAAGSLHFAGMVRVEAAELEVEPGDTLLLIVNGEEWTIPPLARPSP